MIAHQHGIVVGIPKVGAKQIAKRRQRKEALRFAQLVKAEQTDLLYGSVRGLRRRNAASATSEVRNEHE
jgi:hypothetical protein